MKMHMKEREEMGMLPVGSIKDLNVPRYLSAAGERGYTSAKASEITSPPLLIYPPFPRSTSHAIDDADLTARHLWQCICGSLGTGSHFLCSSAISFPRLG